MGLKNALRNISYKNKWTARQYDKLTWYKFRILSKIQSDRTFAKKKYKKIIGKELNLDNPRTFDEKTWYLKLYNRDPLLTICSDKDKVREYVTEKGLAHLLNEVYGVYDKAEDIDFDDLPETCFIKCNHTSGMNILYDRSKPFDRKDFCKRFNFVLKQNYYVMSREWNYKNIKTKIIVEKVLRDANGNLPLDYRFMCFGGEPRLMMHDANTCNEEGKHTGVAMRNMYDADMNLLDVKFSKERHTEPIGLTKEQFNKMKEYAAILAEPFPFCRVDFYLVNDKIVFGELTFYHAGGFNKIEPHEWDLEIGSWIDVSKVK